MNPQYLFSLNYENANFTGFSFETEMDHGDPFFTKKIFLGHHICCTLISDYTYGMKSCLCGSFDFLVLDVGLT